MIPNSGKLKNLVSPVFLEYIVDRHELHDGDGVTADDACISHTGPSPAIYLAVNVDPNPWAIPEAMFTLKAFVPKKRN